MRLETKRLCLRLWKDRDRKPFASMNSDPRVMKYLGPPLSTQQNDDVIDRQIALTQQGQPAFWAVDRLSDNKFIGCIGVKSINFETNFTPAYEIGWRLAPEFWGQGFAPEGAKAALAYVFETWTMDEIFSFTVPANINSQSVMKKIGMKRIAEGDFDHPRLSKTDPLCRHVLFKIERGDVLSGRLTDR